MRFTPSTASYAPHPSFPRKRESSGSETEAAALSERTTRDVEIRRFRNALDSRVRGNDERRTNMVMSLIPGTQH
jgi:hypothetical protein